MKVAPQSIEAGKRNFAEATARRKAAKKARSWLEQLAREERQRLILIKRLHKAIKRYAKAKQREELSTQHGVVIGDYGRCKKVNGTACIPCKEIAAKYVRDLWHSDPKYKAKEKEWYRNNPDKRHNSKNRHRVKGGKHRAYTRNQIIKRDGTDCYICNTPLDFNAATHQGQPGWELYPHIEHVIPLVLGGDDTLENVKLAHAKCNIEKGVRLLPSNISTTHA